MLYWSVGGAAARYIHRTTLDGAAADNVQRFIDVTDSSVSTAAEAAVQDIVVDVRTRRYLVKHTGLHRLQVTAASRRLAVINVITSVSERIR